MWYLSIIGGNPKIYLDVSQDLKTYTMVQLIN